MSNDSLRERFFRERRLLLGVSVVLLAHQLLGITIGKGADTLGLHFDIKDPGQIWWAVWAVWLWTAISAIQQLHSIRFTSEYPTDREEEARLRISDWIATSAVRRDAMRLLGSILPRELGRIFDVALTGFRHSSFPDRGKPSAYTSVGISAKWKSNAASVAAEKAAAFDQAMTTAGWHCTGGSVGFGDGECTLTRVVQVEVTQIRKRKIVSFASIAWTVLSTSWATDYVVPFIIAASPVVIAVLQAVSRARLIRHFGRAASSLLPL